MKKALNILVFWISILICYAQSDTLSKNGFYIPKDINECNKELDKVLDKNAKKKLKEIDENRLKDISGLFIINEWFDNDYTRLANYFKSFSITDWHERDLLIILSYYRLLNNKPFNIGLESQKLNRKRDSLALLREAQYKINAVADSIDGIFIPTDLKSCFWELDKMLNDTTKQEIKNKEREEYIASCHMGLGRWMRNYWGLWGGSRLQVYFIKKNVDYPDNMSGIILEGYQKYLNNEEVNADVLIEEIRIRQEEFMKGVKIETIKFLPPKRKLGLFGSGKDDYKRFLKTRKIKDFDLYSV